jgi:hypothetical protein
LANQAQDILQRNQIPRESFSGAIRTLLQQGRGKYRNVILVGPANCGKTFLFSPLPILYKAFNNPATTTFAWVGVEDAEVILLNDFRWSSQVNIRLHVIPLTAKSVINLYTMLSNCAPIVDSYATLSKG